jgi:transcriptional regulator GlxA family with amidase domain
MERKRVGIILFEDIEVLDFCGPFEVFSATRVNEEKRREEPSPFDVLLVAEHPGPVTTTGGMMVLPHYTFEKCPRLEIVPWRMGCPERVEESDHARLVARPCRGG